MTELAGRMTFPPEWLGDNDWRLCEVVQVLRHDATGTQVFVAGGVLTNGTNLIGVAWPGGQNVCRLNADEDWTLEERVDPKAPSFIRPIWSRVVKSMLHGKHAAEAEARG